MDTLILSQAASPTPQSAALLGAHFALMRATSPAESCHVMAPEDVFAQADVVVCAHQGEDLLGIGAYKALCGAHVELKSMHTTAAARGKGVGRAILLDLMARARATGFQRMSLETGSAVEFAPARALYAAQGFEDCPPFGDYVLDPLSAFMTRQL